MLCFREEWTQLYRRDDPELGELRRRAVLGNLRASRFRSVCWRSLLAVFSSDTSQWLNQLQQQRQHYAQVLRELFVYPWDRSQPEDNPLSQQPEVSLARLCLDVLRSHFFFTLMVGTDTQNVSRIMLYQFYSLVLFVLMNMHKITSNV